MYKRHLVLLVSLVLFLLWLVPIEKSEAISGGTTASENYPWIVALTTVDDPNTSENESDNNFTCGGVLIHPEYILTAHHCWSDGLSGGLNDKFPTSSYLAIIGSNDRTSTSAESIVLSNPIFYGSSWEDDDIMLWHLSSPSTKTPIAITTASNVLSLNNAGNIFKTLGWGDPYPDNLKELSVSNWVDQNPTDDKYYHIEYSAGNSPCSGDSGSPFIIQDWNGNWVLAGLHSGHDYHLEISCGYTDGVDFVYMSVPYYHTWIYNTIATGCENFDGDDVYLHTDITCNGQSVRARTTSLSDIWFDPISVDVPSGKSIFLTDGNGNHVCTDHNMHNLSQDYFNPSGNVIFQNLQDWIVYDDTTCGGSDSNNDGTVEYFLEPQSAIVNLSGGGSSGGTANGYVSIYDATNYDGNKIGDFGIGDHTFTENTLMYSFDLQDEASSFIVKDVYENEKCFDSDVPNMQDYSDYWNKTVEVEVFSSNVCGDINGQVKIYNATNYGGSLLGTYTGGNSYTFPVDTLMFSFDLEGNGSFIVTAPDGRRKCFNEDVPNMESYSEYWRETVKLEVNKHNVCPPEGSPAPAVGSGQGLWRNEFKVLWDEVDIPNLTKIAPTSWGPVSNITLDHIVREKLFGVRFEGCIELPYTDEYTFYLTSADGSQLTINNLGVVNNDGLHNPNEESGKLIISAGTYPFKIDFYTNDTSYELELEVETTLMSRQAVPNSWLSYGTSCPVVTDAGPLLVGEWDFDSYVGTTVTDTVGVNNLTVTNASVLGSTGIFTDGLNTDGVEYAYINNPSNLLRPENNEPLTISFWVQGNVSSGLDYSFLSLMQQPGYPDAGWWLRMDKSTGNITYFYGRDGIGFNHATGTGLTSLLDGDPHHVAITFEGTSSDNTMRAYKDGVLIGTNNIGGSGPIAYHSNMALYIAKSTAAVVDDVKLYRDELSQSEVYDIYANGVIELYGEIGLLGHFDFDSVSGTVVTDTVGSNDLTLTSASIVTTGIFSDSLNTDGSNYAYHVNTSSALKPADNNPFSISFWIRGDTSSGFDYRFLGNMHQDGYNDVGWFIRMDKSTGQLTYFYGRNGLGFNHATGLAITGLLDGEAHLVTLTLSGIGSGHTIKTYKDGVLVDNKSISGSGPVVYHSNMALFVAQTTDAEIDELKFYNRVLPATEVLAQYNLNVGNVYTPPPPPSDIAINWPYSQTLTIDHTQVTSNLADFPVLITSDVITTTVFNPITRTLNVIDFERDNSEHLSIPDGSQSGLDITGDFTVEAWINGEDLSGGSNKTIIAKDATGSRAYNIYVISSGNMGIIINGIGKTQYAGTNLDDGNWHHLTWTYNASAGTVEYFHNGISMGIDTGLPTSIPNTSISFKLGGSGYGDYFDGEMAEVRVFNDIRTDSEIASDMYNSTVSDSSLKGEWQLDNSYTDSSGNGNNLSASGAPVFVSSNVIQPALGEGQLRFTSDVSGNIELPFEVVSFDTQNQTAEIWVKTDVSSSVNTPIFMWYGNESSTSYEKSDQFGSQAVWSEDQVRSHLQSDATDSAGNYDGTASALSYAPGEIGNDGVFSSSYVEYNGNLKTTGNSNCTVSLWFKTTSGAQQFLYGEGSSSNNYPLVQLYTLSGVVYLGVRNDNGSAYDGLTGSATSLDDGSWHYVVMTKNANTYTTYVDGVVDGSFTTSIVPSVNRTGFGALLRGVAGIYLDGNAGELRYNDNVLSSEWIQTEYNNQSNPLVFFVTP